MKNLLLILILFTVSSCDFKSSEEYFNEAIILENQNNLDEAIKKLNKALIKNPDFLPAYINRGVDYSLLGKYEEAINDYNEVIKRDSNNTLALLNRGKNKHRLKDYTGAVSDFQKAIKSKGGENVWLDITPNEFVESGYEFSMEEIRLERGVSLYFLGHLNNAFSDIQFCIDKNFENQIGYYWRGMIYISSNKLELGCRDLIESKRLGNKDAHGEINSYCK